MNAGDRCPAHFATSRSEALTVHKAQGVTVDHALVVADDTTTAEALYVGMTRGRHNNTALVVADTRDPDLEHRPGAPRHRPRPARVRHRTRR